MTFPLTEPAASVFALFNADGSLRQPGGGADRWGTEIERWLIALIAESGDLTLPNLLVQMTVTGGDENDIIASFSHVPSSLSLYQITIPQENTGPVTINGKPLRLGNGEAIQAGYLKPGTYLLADTGTAYRVMSYGDAEAIQATVEVMLTQAIAARDQAVAAASSVTAPKAIVALAEADEPLIDPGYYDIAYRDDSYAIGSGGRYRRSVSEPDLPAVAKFQNGNGAWYQIDELEINPRQLGIVSGTGSDQRTLLQDLLDTCAAIGAEAVIPAGTWRCESALNPSAGQKITMDPRAVLLRTTRDYNWSSTDPNGEHLPMFFANGHDDIVISGGKIVLDCGDQAVRYMPTTGQTVYAFPHEPGEYVFVYRGSADIHGSFSTDAAAGTVTLDAAPTVTTTTVSAVNASTDRFTATGHGLRLNTLVSFSSTGALPGGLNANSIYHVNWIDANTFEIYPSAEDLWFGKNKVDITSAGSGTLTVRTAPVVTMCKALRTNRHAAVIFANGKGCRADNTDVEGLWYQGIVVEDGDGCHVDGCNSTGVLNRAFYGYKGNKGCTWDNLSIDGKDVASGVTVLAYGIVSAPAGNTAERSMVSNSWTNVHLRHALTQSFSIPDAQWATKVDNCSAFDCGDRGLYAQNTANGNPRSLNVTNFTAILPTGIIGAYGAYIFGIVEPQLDNIQTHGGGIGIYIQQCAKGQYSSLHGRSADQGVYIRDGNSNQASDVRGSACFQQGVRIAAEADYQGDNHQAVEPRPSSANGIYIDIPTRANIEGLLAAGHAGNGVRIQGTGVHRSSFKGFQTRANSTGVNIIAGVEKVHVEGWMTDTAPFTNNGTNCTVTNRDA